MPNLFFRKKIKIYLLSIFTTIILSFFVVDYGHKNLFNELKENSQTKELFKEIENQKLLPAPPPIQFHIYNHLLTCILIIGLSTGLKFSEKYLQNEKEKKELEKEKLNSELAFLKNQVSPHFFFNTLNNIYSLIQINTNDAQNAVLKLSKLMRYLLYESECGNTSISKEIEFIKNYIDLMQLRLNNKVDLQFNYPSEYKDFTISPLLFVPFIENAFKHGISYNENSFIHISIEIENKQLIFSCINSYFENINVNIEQNKGIGLENVKKRLNLLFPNKHKLTINKSNKVYSINLTLEHA